MRAIRQTVPTVEFSAARCGENGSCCSQVSFARKFRATSRNQQTLQGLARHSQRTTIFFQKHNSQFCARITASNGEILPVPVVWRPSSSQQEAALALRDLRKKFGDRQASEYAGYESRVNELMPGQTLIRCGVPNNPCSCVDETQIHVWEGDPHLAETLAHEATHAWLYQSGRPFGHCSEGQVDEGCQAVDRLTTEAEGKARGQGLHDRRRISR